MSDTQTRQAHYDPILETIEQLQRSTEEVRRQIQQSVALVAETQETLRRLQPSPWPRRPDTY